MRRPIPARRIALARAAVLTFLLLFGCLYVPASAAMSLPGPVGRRVVGELVTRPFVFYYVQDWRLFAPRIAEFNYPLFLEVRMGNGRHEHVRTVDVTAVAVEKARDHPWAPSRFIYLTQDLGRDLTLLVRSELNVAKFQIENPDVVVPKRVSATLERRRELADQVIQPFGSALIAGMFAGENREGLRPTRFRATIYGIPIDSTNRQGEDLRPLLVYRSHWLEVVDVPAHF